MENNKALTFLYGFLTGFGICLFLVNIMLSELNKELDKALEHKIKNTEELQSEINTLKLVIKSYND